MPDLTLLQPFNLNTTGNFTFANTSVTGNLSSGNANLGNLVSANYFSGNGSLLTGLPAGYANSNVAAYLPTYTGNVSANYFIGNGSTLTNITGSNVDGNVTSAVQSHYANIANSVAGSNVSGQVGNALVAGTVYTNAQPNITSVGTLSSLTVTGNITGGNFVTTGKVYASDFVNGGTGIYLAAGPSGYINFFTSTGDKVSIKDNGNIDVVGTANVGNLITSGNITSGNANLGNLATANYFSGNGSLLTGLPAGYANSNVAAYLPTYTGNFTAGNANISGSLVTGTITTAADSGNISGANYVVANYFSGNGSLLTSLTGANVTGYVPLSTAANTAATVTTNAQPNITSVGTLSSLSVSGDATVTGNFTVGGTTTYINVETFRVEDPLIELGGGANGDPLTTNDGKDRGTLLHYYTTGVVDAFMGWDNSNGEFAFGSNVSVSSEVVTFNNFGNIRASYFIGNGSQLTGTIANANYSTYAGTVITAAQPNITSVGTLASLSITGNVTSGNASLGNLATASYFSGDGSLLTGLPASYSNTNVAAYLPTYTGNVSANYFIGNGSTLTYITGANVNGNVTSAVQSHYANIANSVAGSNVSGQVGNALVAGTVYTNAQPNITSVGTLSSLSVTGNITSGNIDSGNSAIANYFIGNGIYISNIAGANVTGIVANATYATSAGSATTAGTVTTNAQPNITSVGTLAGLTGTGVFNLTDTSNVALGAVANVHISGGTAGYVLSTDGSGTLSWVAQSGGGGSYGNSNVADYLPTYTGNVSANYFIGNGATLTYITGSNVNGQVGNALVAGTVYTNAQPNITSVGTLASLIVTGNSTSGNASLGNLASATYFSGDGSLLTNITGGNVTGIVANATYATSAGSATTAATVTTNAQPNITSVGTLVNTTLGASNSFSGGNLVSATYLTGTLTTGAQSNITSVGSLGSLTVTGLITATGTGIKTSNVQDSSGTVTIVTGYGSVSGAVGVYGNITVGTSGTGFFIGNGSYLSGLTGGNVSGQVGNALVAGTVYTNAQPNITSVGTLSALTVNGLTNLGAVGNLTITGGTANYVLQTNGSGALSWVAQSGGGGSPTITDDTTTNATYYPVYATASSGSLSTAGVSSTKLQFNPSLGQLTITDLNSLSDATLKTNWQTIDDPFSILDQLFGMGFEWTDNGRKSYGLSAQNVEQILPELVGTTAQGKKTVNYIPIIAFLLEALKKNNKELQEIKSSIKPKRQSTKKDK